MNIASPPEEREGAWLKHDRSVPRWDDASRAWHGCESLGGLPADWSGLVGSLAAETGLHAYQRRNIPVLSLGGQSLLAGPRPPYFSWHGHPQQTGQPDYSTDDRKIAGSGLYLAQRFETACRIAGTHGEVLAFYANASRLILLDARWERRYSEEEASTLGVSALPGGMSGWDLLFRLNHLHGRGKRLTAFLQALGFNGVAYGSTSRGEGGWCLHDPRVFKRVMRTSDWSREEIRRREEFDPTPIASGSRPLMG